MSLYLFKCRLLYVQDLGINLEYNIALFLANDSIDFMTDVQTEVSFMRTRRSASY